MRNFSPKFNFKSIDSKAINLIACPDQYVATYNPGIPANPVSSRTYINIDYVYSASGKPVCTNLLLDTIVIVLESPHKDEYSYAGGVSTPKGPLVGSWNIFQLQFHRAIQSSALWTTVSIAKVYNIAFVNAVQYQCSLGKPLSGKNSYANQKNLNVKNSWSQAFDVDLEKRLTALQPSLIIDLSGKKQEIHNNISFMISNSSNLKTVPYTFGAHASRWSYLLNRFGSGYTLIN